MVNQQVLQGHWDEIKGKLRAHWASLSDDDLEQCQGNMQQLMGVIQRKTGEARDTIENYLEEIVTESGGDLENASQSAREYARFAAASVHGARGKQETVLKWRPSKCASRCAKDTPRPNKWCVSDQSSRWRFALARV